MSVIPLTLTISLCLVFTFVLFFLREYGRHRFSSAESEALLPLAEETPRAVEKVSRRRDSARAHDDHSATCDHQQGERSSCDDCRHGQGR